jgi:hypothetical protein
MPLIMPEKMGELYSRGAAQIEIPGFSHDDRRSVMITCARILKEWQEATDNKSTTASKLTDLLNHTLLPDLETATNPTEFGIRGPRNTRDPKIYWHLGYQIRQAPSKDTTSELRTLAQDLPDLLDAMCASWSDTMRELGMHDAAVNTLMPNDRMQRVVLLRALLYLDFENMEMWSEVFQPHADLGLGTIELYKSDEEIFDVVPLSPTLLEGGYDQVRTNTINHLYRNRGYFLPKMSESEAYFMISAGLYGLAEHFRIGLPTDLPIGFHGGYKKYDGVLPNRDDAFGADRANLVGFFQPPLEILGKLSLFEADYTIPSVASCRPFSRA